ncbi:hypothetical protein O1D97_12170 [Marinomonas sp. 15G1-11]|uniref:Uncharacterized protein n=1 Tax=Marinomonas phaeophyticola TaxID=3004091 RepID=A0ABT4JVE5_9GAMM|nr:hypothetical protein [Marinomonas sp. 15G1-11]MCZ2722361.1 hypothetical protein [Marinomonas sp. 15G1-11]
MDILQEVTQSKTLIDELLHNLNLLSSDGEGKISEALPDEMCLKRNYVEETHKKLLENDDFSLSEKGLNTFREESQSLLYYLRDQHQKRELSDVASKKNNRLFNYKNHVLTWEEPIGWTALLFHGIFLIVAILLSAAWTLLAFDISDKNSLILVSSLVPIIFILSPNPPAIKELGIKKKFTLISANFLFWKSLFRTIPIMIICIAIAIKNHYWKDDALIIFSVVLSISILFTRNRSQYWLATPKNIDLIDNPTNSGDRDA